MNCFLFGQWLTTEVPDQYNNSWTLWHTIACDMCYNRNILVIRFQMVMIDRIVTNKLLNQHLMFLHDCLVTTICPEMSNISPPQKLCHSQGQYVTNITVDKSLLTNAKNRAVYLSTEWTLIGYHCRTQIFKNDLNCIFE